MRHYVFSGSDQMAVLSILAKLENACNANRVLEPVAVSCVHSHMEWKAESLLAIQSTESSMAVDFKRSEMLQAYRDVVSFLF